MANIKTDGRDPRARALPQEIMASGATALQEFIAALGPNRRNTYSYGESHTTGLGRLPLTFQQWLR